jgi:hypothetical protein
VTGKEQSIGEIVAQLADKYARTTAAPDTEKQP